MPFQNLSADAENEYFCDGLAEEILNALGAVRGLQVAARASSFYFKGKATQPGPPDSRALLYRPARHGLCAQWKQ
jgi:TolB-like protein